VGNIRRKKVPKRRGKNRYFKGRGLGEKERRQEKRKGERPRNTKRVERGGKGRRDFPGPP